LVADQDDELGGWRRAGKPASAAWCCRARVAAGYGLIRHDLCRQPGARSPAGW